MIDLKRVLVPTDFSERSLCALRYGAAMAEKFDAELLLLHILQDLALFIPEAVTLAPSVAPPVEEYKQKALEGLRQLATDNQISHLKVETHVTEGAPHEAIVRVAKEKDVDLIVLGTHGRTGLAHFIMGSEAEKVVRFATCPVLTLHSPDGE